MHDHKGYSSTLASDLVTKGGSPKVTIDGINHHRYAVQDCTGDRSTVISISFTFNISYTTCIVDDMKNGLHICNLECNRVKNNVDNPPIAS